MVRCGADDPMRVPPYGGAGAEHEYRGNDAYNTPKLAGRLPSFRRNRPGLGMRPRRALAHDAAQVLRHRLVQDLLAQRPQRIALSPHRLDVRGDARMRQQVSRYRGAIALVQPSVDVVLDLLVRERIALNACLFSAPRLAGPSATPRPASSA